jgi:hypothetical protein
MLATASRIGRGTALPVHVSEPLKRRCNITQAKAKLAFNFIAIFLDQFAGGVNFVIAIYIFLAAPHMDRTSRTC